MEIGPYGDPTTAIVEFRNPSGELPSTKQMGFQPQRKAKISRVRPAVPLHKAPNLGPGRVHKMPERLHERHLNVFERHLNVRMRHLNVCMRRLCFTNLSARYVSNGS